MKQHKPLRQLLDEVELNEANIEIIKDILLGNNTAVIPFQSVAFTPEHFFFRARPHASRSICTTRKDVSYPPKPEMVKTGRANMVGNRTFYGGVATPEVKDGYMIAMQEASVVRYGWIPPVQTFTVSRWRPRHTVELASFVPGEMLANGMNIAKEMHQATRQMVEQMAEPYRSHTAELISVLHDEFTKEVHGDVNKYWISAIFSSIIYTQEIGIMYPSMRTEYKGFNIAVPAQKWDENFDLVDCVLYQYHTKGNKSRVVPYKYAPSPREPFQWEDLPPHPMSLPFMLHPYPHVKPD